MTMIDQTGKQQQQERGEQDWYEVEVEGHIRPQWFDWIDGWEITLLPDGNTLLSGLVIDQSALHGLFARIRDLNIKMISLKKCAHPQTYETQGMKKEEQ